MNPRVTLARLAGSLAHWGTVNLAHRGGGNIPGAVALRVDPNVVGELSASLEPRIVVTGTNGKTTTTGLIADALASGGSAVVCNRAGNNMESGVAAALVLAGPDRKGERRIGCFECDELYTVRVLPAMRPRALVLLNLFRDQLDRYGEIDHTQDVIAKALQGSPETAVIFDADDPLCAAIADRVDNPGVPFGIDEPTGIEADRISDSRFCARCNAPLDYEYVHYGQLGKYRCPECGWARPELAFAAVNVRMGEEGFEFDVEDRRGGAAVRQHVRTRWNGLHMVYNVTAAFAAFVIGGGEARAFQEVLDAYEPASGRGKVYELDGGRAVASNLAKNPTGFDRMISQIKAEKGSAVAFFLIHEVVEVLKRSEDSLRIATRVAGEIAPFRFLADVDFVDGNVFFGGNFRSVNFADFVDRVVERLIKFRFGERTFAFKPMRYAPLMQIRPTAFAKVRHRAVVGKANHHVLGRRLIGFGSEPQSHHVFADVAAVRTARAVADERPASHEVSVLGLARDRRGAEEAAHFAVGRLVLFNVRIDAGEVVSVVGVLDRGAAREKDGSEGE